MNEYLVTFRLNDGSEITTLETGDSPGKAHDKAVRLWTTLPMITLDTPAGVFRSFRSADIVEVSTEERGS